MKKIVEVSNEYYVSNFRRKEHIYKINSQGVGLKFWDKEVIVCDVYYKPKKTRRKITKYRSYPVGLPQIGVAEYHAYKNGATNDYGIGNYIIWVLNKWK